MTETELRDEQTTLLTSLNELHTTAEGRALTEDEQTRWDTDTARVEEIDGILARYQRASELANRPGHVESGDGATGAPEVMRRVDPFDGEVRSLSYGEARDKALKALESRDLTGHLEDRQKEHMERLFRTRSRNTDGGALARRLLVTESEAYRSAFMKVVTKTQPVLTPEEARALQAFDEIRAMSIGTDASGGFGVPVLIDPTIILTGQGSPNYFFQLARVETITTDEWKGVSSAGVSWSFDAEAAEVSDDAPTLAQPNVVTKKAQGFIPYSIEVGMDYPGFAAEMATLLAEGYNELVTEKLTTGSASDDPTGIVTALDANTNVEVTPTTDGAFGAVDLYKLWDNLPIKYRMKDSCAWMASTDVVNEIRNFGTTLGSNFTVDLTDESIPRLFGRRFFQNDFMADFTGTTGAANLLVVGDWTNFLIAQRAGMSVELVPHLLGSNRRPSGQRGWYAWARIGSDSVNDLGFRLLQNQ
jgi:HK97 family phage major capsid protein